MSATTDTTTRTGEPTKENLFDRVADELGFETVAETGRNDRFRYPELVRVYERLHDLGEIPTPRNEGMNRADLRGAIASAVGVEGHAGRPVTKPVLSELVGILCSDDVVTDGGSLAASPSGATLPRPHPTEEDYQRAEDYGHVYEWVTVEECVCVSRRQNSTRYHTRWLVEEDGTLRPACAGYRPNPNRDHRLVEEASISRTKQKCGYCENEEAKL